MLLQVFLGSGLSSTLSPTISVSSEVGSPFKISLSEHVLGMSGKKGIFLFLREISTLLDVVEKLCNHESC